MDDLLPCQLLVFHWDLGTGRFRRGCLRRTALVPRRCCWRPVGYGDGKLVNFIFFVSSPVYFSVSSPFLLSESLFLACPQTLVLKARRSRRRLPLFVVLTATTDEFFVLYGDTSCEDASCCRDKTSESLVPVAVGTNGLVSSDSRERGRAQRETLDGVCLAQQRPGQSGRTMFMSRSYMRCATLL